MTPRGTRGTSGDAGRQIGQPDARDQDVPSNVPAAPSWRLPGQTRLEGLLNCVPNREHAGDRAPWRPGHTMQLHCRDAQSLDRKRISIVGHAGYRNFVAGHRTVAIGSQSLVCEGNRTIDVGRSDSSDSVKGSGVEWGHDKLHVKGNAKLMFAGRFVHMHGTVERTWNGPAHAMAGWFFGVRSLGLFVRAVGGAAVEFAPIHTTGAYGGSARTAVARSHIAALGYRAATRCARAYGIYYSRAPFVITPLFLKRSKRPTRHSPTSTKLARLGKWAARGLSGALTGGLSMIGGIPIIGFVLLLIHVPYVLIRFGRSLRRHEEVPPPRPMRVHNVFCHTRIDTRTTVRFL